MGYTDPASGSILLMLLYASLAGLGIYLGSVWTKIKRFFRKGDKNSLQDDNDNDEDE